jgi:hypothetical protein
MYTACTFRMAYALNIHFLDNVPEYFIYIALLAWLAAFAGFIRSVLTQFKWLISKSTV